MRTHLIASMVACLSGTAIGQIKYIGDYAGKAYFVSDRVMTIADARAYASGAGGYVACIGDSGENAFLATATGGGTRLWIGASDKAVDGVWRWDSGEPFVYSNWSPGEPNNGGPIDDEDFCITNYTAPGNWNDIEYDGDVARPSKFHAIFESLPIRFLGEYNGHMYVVSADKLTMPEARSLASSLGGHVACIATQTENMAVSLMSGGDERLWIGASDKLQEGVWRWDSGEPFVYSAWASGEPNSGGPIGDEDYCITNFTAPGNWNDIEYDGDVSNPSRFRSVIEIVPAPGSVAVPCLAFVVYRRQRR